MKINIHDIIIPNRIRTEPGDLSALKNSIASVGLLNPIILTESYEILSGYRRYLACRELGWHEIDARIVELGDNKVQKLDLEYHENVGRLELSYECFPPTLAPSFLQGINLRIAWLVWFPYLAI